MSRHLLVILVGLSAIVMDDAATPVYAQAYPRVMSPTGRFYGPTQAHYQYERQYGRPWYGGPAQFNPNTGVNIQVGVGGWGGYPRFGGFYGAAPFVDYGVAPGFVPFGGYGYGVPAYGVYQNQFGVNQYGFGSVQYQQIGPQGPQGMLPLFGAAPTFSWQQPDALQQPLVQQPQLRGPGPQFGGGPQPQQQLQPQNAAPAGPAMAPEPLMARPHNFLPAPPSTVAQRQRSLHLQGQGDIWFRQQNFLQAYSRYKQAAAAAPDLGAPRFRMAYALMALHRYELAVPEMQRGIRLDPSYPVTGDSPGKIYGDENRIATAALPQAVAAWVRQDIRSSDRLFLLGALLLINGDHVRARVLLETAAQFGAEGPTDHIAAFLRLEAGANPEAANQGGANPGTNGQQPPVDNRDDRPPVPEEVEELLRDNQNFLPPAVPPVGPQAKPKAGGLNAPRLLPQPKPEALPSPVPPVTPQPVLPAAPKAGPPPVAPQETASGYQPIPKKGAPPETQPAEETPSEVQPAGQETPESEPQNSVPENAAESAPSNDSGPVIPIPGSGK